VVEVPNATGRVGTTKREELFAFLILAILIWPVIAVGIVGGYGFLIWMSQVILGPPGPPH
jgi:nitrate reductase NapE